MGTVPVDGRKLKFKLECERKGFDKNFKKKTFESDLYLIMNGTRFFFLYIHISNVETLKKRKKG